MILKLIVFEWKCDMRNRNSILGIFLYVFTILFFCLQSFKKINDPMVWNNLYWVVLIFSALNSTSKNFSAYSRGRFLYLYSITTPENFIFAKLIYNTVFMLTIAIITLFIYGVFMGFDPFINSNKGLYCYSILTGTIGFATVLTFISIIAVKANSGTALTAILALPLLIPLVLSITELLALAINNLPVNLSGSSFWIPPLCDAFVLGLAFLLFPYLWRE